VIVSNTYALKSFVHNKHAGTAPVGGKYIGRGSPYGNLAIIGRDGGRDEVCDKFEKYQLPKLDLRPLIGCHLICFCAPQRCHGHSIVTAIMTALERADDPRLDFYRQASQPDLFSIARK
jgi:hypothetical protein